MKKILLLILFTSLLKITSAQITKNNWLVGGSFSFNSTNYNSESSSNYKEKTFAILPNIGYFFADKLAAGLSASLTGRKYTPGNADIPGTSYGGKYSAFNIGPFIRYYFLSTGKPYNLFVNTIYQYQIQTFKPDIPATRDKQSANIYAVNIGPVIYFNNCVGIEFTIGYSSLKYEHFAGRNNSVTANIGLQVHLEKE